MTKAYPYLAILIFIATHSIATAEEKQATVRDELIKMESVIKVFSASDNLSWVFPDIKGIGTSSGFPVKAFYDGIKQICESRGGILETQTSTRDPFTGKIQTSYTPINTEQDLGLLQELTYHLSTGDRCKNVFEVVQVFGKKTYTEALGTIFREKSLVIKHLAPQPMTQKGIAHLSYDDIYFPQDGELLENVPEIVNEPDGMFSFMESANIEEPGDFTYLAFLCKKFNGTARYIVNKGKFVPNKYGSIKQYDEKTQEWVPGNYRAHLAETELAEAFQYAAVNNLYGNNLGKEWYFQCSGSKPFLAKRYFIYGRRDNGESYVSKKHFLFAAGRTFDGIEYESLEQPIAKSPDAPSQEMDDSGMKAGLQEGNERLNENDDKQKDQEMTDNPELEKLKKPWKN